MDGEIHSWLSFARQKLDEVTLIARALNGGRQSVASQLDENRRFVEGRRKSPRITNPRVRERMAGLTAALGRRASPFAKRRAVQEGSLPLPLFPTTTIGSFPQTKEVRALRASLKSGAIDQAAYEKSIEKEIERTIRLQEKLGLDVLVHGEFERNDMVEYFGEMLSGFTFTANGWVQSYGSRCVKPPIIYGDVERPAPMTVRWSTYAQSLTSRPVKGMLTGPVTMLSWSFVRNDQPAELTCKQIALAIRDEVKDLEAAGIRVIQIDEPALREAASPAPLAVEGLPEVGGGGVPHRLQRRRATPRRSTPTCATRSSTTSSPPLPPWTPTSCPSRPRAPAWSCSALLRHVPLPEPDRPRRVRHPFPTGPGHRGSRRPPQKGALGPSPVPALGQPGLRAEDARVEGSGAVAGRSGGRGAQPAGELCGRQREGGAGAKKVVDGAKRSG